MVLLASCQLDTEKSQASFEELPLIRLVHAHGYKALMGEAALLQVDCTRRQAEQVMENKCVSPGWLLQSLFPETALTMNCHSAVYDEVNPCPAQLLLARAFIIPVARNNKENCP